MSSLLYSTNVNDFSSDQVNLRLTGIYGTISAAGTTSIYKKFDEVRLVNGGTLLVADGLWGDTVALRVVDRDNIYGLGANTILRTFGEDYYINPDSTFQVKYEVPYVARIPAGIYIQIDYTAISETTRQLVLNLITHIPI
jgi:hypothetical protein